MSQHPNPKWKRWNGKKSFDFSQLEHGPIYFYVGAGLAQGAGLVGWHEMGCLIKHYLHHYEKGRTKAAKYPEDKPKKLERLINRFAKEVASNSVDSEHVLGRVALLNIMLRYRAPCVDVRPGNDPDRPRARPGAEPSAEDLVLHSLIWRTGCHGVLTTNYDMLFEHAYSLFDHGAALRSYRYNAYFLRYILSNRRFVLKLHGDINDLKSMEFRPSEAWSAGSPFRDHGSNLKEVYNAALLRGHMIFVGCGFRDKTINNLHKKRRARRRAISQPLWRDQPKKEQNCRVALMCSKDFKECLNDKDEPLQAFNDILFLTYRDHRELKEILEKIVAARSEIHEAWQPCPEASDIRRQLFLSTQPRKPKRNVSTEEWTCRSKPYRPNKAS